MAFNFHYPWTNMHELNLDWIVAKIKEFAGRIADFEETGLKNPYPLHIKAGYGEADYDGSEPVSLDVNGAVNAAINAAPHVHYTAQTLTAAQKTQARTNIDALQKSNTAETSVYGHTTNNVDVNYPLPLSVALGGTGHSTEATALLALGGVSFNEQTLTAEQKAQARTNIGAGGDVTGAVRYDEEQELTEEQQARAVANVGLDTVLENMADDIDANTDAINEQSSQISDTRNMISDIWAQRTWNVGEYCIHNNKLWKCITSNSSAPTEGANWTAVTVDEIVKSEASSELIYEGGTTFKNDIGSVLPLLKTPDKGTLSIVGYGDSIASQYIFNLVIPVAAGAAHHPFSIQGAISTLRTRNTNSNTFEILSTTYQDELFIKNIYWNK